MFQFSKISQNIANECGCPKQTEGLCGIMYRTAC